MNEICRGCGVPLFGREQNLCRGWLFTAYAKSCHAQCLDWLAHEYPDLIVQGQVYGPMGERELLITDPGLDLWLESRPERQRQP